MSERCDETSSPERKLLLDGFELGGSLLTKVIRGEKRDKLCVGKGGKKHVKNEHVVLSGQTVSLWLFFLLGGVGKSSHFFSISSYNGYVILKE